MTRRISTLTEIKSISCFHRYSNAKTISKMPERNLHEGFELNVYLSGTYEYILGKNVYKVSPGDITLNTCTVFHASRPTDENNNDKITVVFNAEGIDLKEEFCQFLADDECKTLIEMLIKETEEHCNIDDLCALNGMTDVSKKLIEILLAKLLRLESKPRYSDEKDALTYKRAVEFMQKNINRNPNVDEIAENTGVCMTIIKRVFSKYAGKGVNSYFVEMKIEEAKKELEKGLSCNEVSKKLGFSSQAYFSRRFKSICGILPSKYEAKSEG